LMSGVPEMNPLFGTPSFITTSRSRGKRVSNRSFLHSCLPHHDRRLWIGAIRSTRMDSLSEHGLALTCT